MRQSKPDQRLSSAQVSHTPRWLREKLTSDLVDKGHNSSRIIAWGTTRTTVERLPDGRYHMIARTAVLDTYNSEGATFLQLNDLHRVPGSYAMAHTHLFAGIFQEYIAEAGGVPRYLPPRRMLGESKKKAQWSAVSQGCNQEVMHDYVVDTPPGALHRIRGDSPLVTCQMRFEAPGLTTDVETIIFKMLDPRYLQWAVAARRLQQRPATALAAATAELVRTADGEPAADGSYEQDAWRDVLARTRRILGRG